MARSVLLHDQKADFDAQQQKPDVATRDAKLEDSLQDILPIRYSESELPMSRIIRLRRSST